MSEALPSPARPAGFAESFRLVAMDIKLAHSVFALPFAILGAFLVGPTRAAAPKPTWTDFLIILAIVVPCMVFARTWAMLVNRLADRHFDAQNDRTRRRVFASGRLSPARGWFFAFLSALLFGACTSLFWFLFKNPWPAILACPVLLWIAFYSFTKRFTALCHVFLGGALGVSPLAAAIATNPEALLTTPSVWWIAGFVVLWVAGFDVLYALQDEDFDKARGLSSIPALLGTTGALWTARGLHLAGYFALLASWTSDTRLNWLFGGGVGVVGALLVLEHAVVAKRGKAGIPMAFFTLNGVVSCVLGAAGCVDLVW